MKAPPAHQLALLLDSHAPFSPPALVPEVSVFYGRSLVEVWEAAERLGQGMLPAPFWAYPWAAGVALARVLLDHPDWVQGKAVLDVGCGGGMTALAAARAGAGRVVANDLDPWALATVDIAAARQGLLVEMLLGDLTNDMTTVEPFDLVCCSDLAYEKAQAPRQRALLSHARKHGARVLVADAGRTYFDPAGMELVAEFTIEVPPDLEGVAVRVARVFELE